jgi:hypothetical protein
MTLAVDIGFDYLAYAHLYEEGKAVNYGIFPFIGYSGKPEACADFLNTFGFRKLIIEKQMNINYKCATIQHFLQGAAATNPDVEVEIQDARKKFKKLGVICDTRGKAHKRLSTELALKWLQSGEVFDDSGMKLIEYEKKDDIADAINMVRPSC